VRRIDPYLASLTDSELAEFYAVTLGGDRGCVEGVFYRNADFGGEIDRRVLESYGKDDHENRG
jgi:hypothetical protein